MFNTLTMMLASSFLFPHLWLALPLPPEVPLCYPLAMPVFSTTVLHTISIVHLLLFQEICEEDGHRGSLSLAIWCLSGLLNGLVQYAILQSSRKSGIGSTTSHAAPPTLPSGSGSSHTVPLPVLISSPCGVWDGCWRGQALPCLGKRSLLVQGNDPSVCASDLLMGLGRSPGCFLLRSLQASPVSFYLRWRCRSLIRSPLSIRFSLETSLFCIVWLERDDGAALGGADVCAHPPSLCSILALLWKDATLDGA